MATFVTMQVLVADDSVANTKRIAPGTHSKGITPLILRHRQSPKKGREPIENPVLFTPFVHLLNKDNG